MATEEKVVRYTLTHKDLFAFNFRAMMENRILQFMTVLFMLSFMYLGFHTPPQKGQPELPLTGRIVIAVLMGLFVLLGMFVLQVALLLVTIWTKKFKGLIGEHELKLTDAGMLSQSANSESLRKWTGLLKVTSTNRYLYLYVNETTAQIVPKRYFASPAEAQSFEQMIRERMKVG
jgi:hypothetical protein